MCQGAHTRPLIFWHYPHAPPVLLINPAHYEGSSQKIPKVLDYSDAWHDAAEKEKQAETHLYEWALCLLLA